MAVLENNGVRIPMAMLHIVSRIDDVVQSVEVHDVAVLEYNGVRLPMAMLHIVSRIGDVVQSVEVCNEVF